MQTTRRTASTQEAARSSTLWIPQNYGQKFAFRWLETVLFFSLETVWYPGPWFLPWTPVGSIIQSPTPRKWSWESHRQANDDVIFAGLKLGTRPKHKRLRRDETSSPASWKLTALWLRVQEVQTHFELSSQDLRTCWISNLFRPKTICWFIPSRIKHKSEPVNWSDTELKKSDSRSSDVTVCRGCGQDSVTSL